VVFTYLSPVAGLRVHLLVSCCGVEGLSDGVFAVLGGPEGRGGLGEASVIRSIGI
jgi:hypothetical protein